MNPINLFLLVAAFQGFVLSFLILFSSFFKSKSNSYLGYTIGILSLLMLNIFLSNIRLFDNYPKLSMINTIEWALLSSALFFCYIVKVMNHDLAYSKKLNWLFLPFGLSVLLNIVVHLEFTFSLYKIEFNGKDFFYDLVFGLQELFVYLFSLTLLFWSYRLLKKWKHTSPTQRWIKKLWLFITFIALTWIALFLFDVLIVPSFPKWDHYIFYDLYILAIQLSLFVYWVAYTGMYKLKIATDREEILSLLKKNSKTIEPSENKTGHNDTTQASTTQFLENNAYFLQLEQLLQEHYIYRDPDLSREIVAKKLGISVGYLSQIVNKVTNKNFAAYINSYRIEEAKRMILDSQFDKYSLLSIGLESGFKSKSAFYNSFKKETGSTPNVFKNEY